MNGDLLLHMGLPLVAAVLVAVVLLLFRRRPDSAASGRPRGDRGRQPGARRLPVDTAGRLPTNLDLMEVKRCAARPACSVGMAITPRRRRNVRWRTTRSTSSSRRGPRHGVSLPMLRVPVDAGRDAERAYHLVVVREKTGSAWWAWPQALRRGIRRWSATSLRRTQRRFLCAALAGTLVLDRRAPGSAAWRHRDPRGVVLVQAARRPLSSAARYLSLRDSRAGRRVGGQSRPGIYGRGAVAFGRTTTHGIPRQWAGPPPPMLRFAGFVALFYPVLAMASPPARRGAGAPGRPGACSWSLMCRVAWGRWIVGPPENASCDGHVLHSRRDDGLAEWGRAAASILPQIAPCWCSSRWRTIRAP